MFLRCISAAGLAAFALFTMPAAHAARSYDNCTGYIDSVPATISTQGTWCLRADLSTGLTNTNAITINTSNVTIDCNDFKLGGLSAGMGTQSIGIRAMDRSNTTVRNCTVRGFQIGVWVDGDGVVIEDNRIDGNTGTGIKLWGDGAIIRRNLITSTGGSTLPTSTSATGIETLRTVEIVDNIIDGVAPLSDQGTAVGISSAFSAGGTISGNRVRGLVAGTTDDSMIAIAVYQPLSQFVSGNFLAGNNFGIGVRCDPGQGTVVRNNLTAKLTLALKNCSNTN